MVGGEGVILAKMRKCEGHRWDIGKGCRLIIYNAMEGCGSCVPNAVLRVGRR